MTKTILLIHSGDKSIDVWNYWYYYFKKYYSCQEFMDVYFLSENLSKDYNGVIFKHTGDVLWADGLMTFLNTINAKYIVYQHEDYFLTEKTWHDSMKHLIDIVEERNYKLLKCCGWWAGFMTDKAPMQEIDRENNIWLYNNESPYLISHQTSIWEREFFITTLRRGESPWQHEMDGTRRLRARNIPIYAFRGKCPLEYAETMVHGTIRKGFERFFEEIDKQEGK